MYYSVNKLSLNCLCFGIGNCKTSKLLAGQADLQSNWPLQASEKTQSPNRNPSHRNILYHLLIHYKFILLMSILFISFDSRYHHHSWWATVLCTTIYHSLFLHHSSWSLPYYHSILIVSIMHPPHSSSSSSFYHKLSRELVLDFSKKLHAHNLGCKHMVLIMK